METTAVSLCVFLGTAVDLTGRPMVEVAAMGADKRKPFNT